MPWKNTIQQPVLVLPWQSQNPQYRITTTRMFTNTRTRTAYTHKWRNTHELVMNTWGKTHIITNHLTILRASFLGRTWSIYSPMWGNCSNTWLLIPFCTDDLELLTLVTISLAMNLQQRTKFHSAKYWSSPKASWTKSYQYYTSPATSRWLFWWRQTCCKLLKNIWAS